MDRTFAKQEEGKQPFTYTHMHGEEFGNPPRKIFSQAAQTMMNEREKEFEKIKEERRQAELEKLRKRRKINEENIKNMKRFVGTFATKDAFTPVEFDKYR